MGAQTTTPHEELRNLIHGYRISQALYAAAALGIADLLADGPRSADDLATASGAHGPSLARVLRLLASMGVFAEIADGRFALTPLAEPLRGDAPGSLRPMVLYNAGASLWSSWGQILHSVRTGEPAFAHVHGSDFFAYFRQHPDEGRSSISSWSARPCRPRGRWRPPTTSRPSGPLSMSAAGMAR